MAGDGEASVVDGGVAWMAPLDKSLISLKIIFLLTLPY